MSLGLAACGGSDLDPGAGDDPGTGSRTLSIDGSVTARARLSNARSASELDTELSVRIQRSGQNVTTGTVTMTSSSGTVVLAFDPTSDGGRWRGNAAGYDEVYILDVDSGPDNVHDVRVDGPSIHTFSEPQAGATVDAALPLMVKWSSKGSDTAAIETENLDHVSIEDSGSYSMPAGALKSERDKAKDNEIDLTRTNRVTPEGAAGGSELSVSIENRITVVAMPNPGA